MAFQLFAKPDWRNHKITAALAWLACGAIVASGCSGRKKAVERERTGPFEHAMVFESAEEPLKASPLWSKAMPGLITDMSMARGAGSILVSTMPDSERDPEETPDAGRGHLLSLWDASGNPVFQKQMPSQTRAQAISEDGSLIIVADYNSEVHALDRSGKKLWTAEGMCRPILFDRTRRILCFHDDEARPQFAFEVYDWTGAQVMTYPIKKDALGIKVSHDQRAFVVSLTQGNVVLFSEDFHELWKKSVKGEVVDVAVSDSKDRKVAVLYHSISNGQKVALFDREGRLLGETTPLSHLEQIELTWDGEGILGYGNGPKGQRIAMYVDSPKLGLKEAWSRGDARYADYSSTMIVTKDSVVVGYEDVAPSDRHSHILAFDFDGKLKWNVPLVTEEGAYLYGQAFSSEKALLSVGTDDAMLSLYQVGARAPNGR